MTPLITKPLVDAILPFVMTNGNDGRGSRWFKSSKVRDNAQNVLLSAGLSRKPFAHVVTVHVTRILGPGERLWDSSSIGRGNWKEIEDALVACGWFVDDGPKWIRETRFFQEAGMRHVGPKIRLQVYGGENGN